MKWWDKSWNPVIGCTKCSPACDNCYAEALHNQRHEAFKRGTMYHDCYCDPFKAVRFLSERLDQPLHWRKPLRIFVGNMGDLFHESVTDAQLDLIFAIMAMASSAHTFMLCTKRPERMAAYLNHEYRQERIFKAAGQSNAFCLDWPLPNVWLGTTIWDQASADRAVPLLLSTPAAKRFVSVEPMLGPVDLTDYLSLNGKAFHRGGYTDSLDWVICGGETGPGARPMHPDWPRSLRDQCVAAGVPFFFKQWGEWSSFYDRDIDDPDWRECPRCDVRTERYVNLAGGHGFHGDRVCAMRRVGTRKAGRILDGQEWSEVPA